MKKIAVRLFAVLMTLTIIAGASVCGAGALSFPTDVKPQSKSVLLVSMDNGQTVYEKEADKKMYPASTTKIMTCSTSLTARAAQRRSSPTISAKR